MPENNGAPDGSGRIRTGDVSGTMIVGNRNTVTTLNITAGHGSAITLNAGPPPNPVKRQPISHLPRSGADPLIGRERELQALQQAIGARQLVQIWGTAGVGKSALLRHLARTLPRGPEGVAYIEAGGRTADDLAQAIFDISFDAPNYKPSLEVLKEHLKTLRLRIYLDDAGLDEKGLRRLFDLAGQSAFVFTSQHRSPVGGVHAIRLDGLTDTAGVQLVQTVLARQLRPEEAQTVAALCDALHGNPLRLRRIALSVATGKRLPTIADLPALLPALLNRLQPAERDLLHLLGSLSGAELAARQLNALLGRTDSDALAGGLVRHGLLIASETGYGCPPDVAECVLKSRMTQFPPDRLCRALTAWVESRETTPDQVAAHFQALDVAVLGAERSGQAQLGVELARAASPKLALSRQFDAWGSLLGAGWAAAKSVGDRAGEEFFLREARTRRKAIGRAALTTTLALEAGVLWKELAALQAHSVAHHAATTALTAVPPVAPLAPVVPVAPVTPVAPVAPVTPVAPVHTPVTPPTVTHPVVSPPTVPHPIPTPTAPAPVHAPTPPHVIDLSQAAQQPPPTGHVPTGHVPTGHAAGAHSPSHALPHKIDLSGAHSSAAHSTHAAGTATTTSTGHAAVATAGAATAKGGAALAVACVVGFTAVIGVGAVVYAKNQSDRTPAAQAAYPSIPTRPIYTPRPPVPPVYTPKPPAPPPLVTPDPVDPVCATVVTELGQENQQYNADLPMVHSAVESYNNAVDAHNSGRTSAVPDDSAMNARVDIILKDVRASETTLRGAISQARDRSVVADLKGLLTARQQDESQFRSFRNKTSKSYDTASSASAFNSAWQSLVLHCTAF
ncbi:AAA family ATPase [Kitasatospora sp. NPDC058162]|uniref:AAA family ATPase n=1 Tax=Kitasatospora sp. NPDC058162 TaxID=3346362 RepID=UPI0036DC40C9